MTDFNDVMKKLANGTYPDITTMALPPLNQALPTMPQTDFPLPQNPGYYSREAFNLAGLPANVTSVPAMPSMVAAPLPGVGGGGGIVGDALGIIPIGATDAPAPPGPTDISAPFYSGAMTVGQETGVQPDTTGPTLWQRVKHGLVSIVDPVATAVTGNPAIGAAAGKLADHAAGPLPPTMIADTPLTNAVFSPVNNMVGPDPSALGAELSGTGMDYGDTYQNLFQTPDYGGPWDYSSIDPAEDYFLHNLGGIGDYDYISGYS